MARCPLCESDVPDGRPGCDACGQPFNRAMTARAAPDLVKRAIDAARKDLLASSRDPADSTFARSLVDRAEQTEAAGDFGRALDLARASRHALEIAKRKTRVAEALRHADAVLERAKKAGIETLAFEGNIEGARGLAARGHHVAAERLLRRVSIRTLDQRRERVLQGILDKAASRVRYAKERGGTVDDAEGHLREARQAMATREYTKIRPLAAKAIDRADNQRRYARAETIVDRAAADVEAARRDGVNITEARKHLTQARDALRLGVYADIPLLAQRARNSLREARRFAAADFVFRESAREAARERRKGADVGRADAILAEAAEALAGKDYARVRVLAKDAHDAVREASVLRNVRDAFGSLQVDADDLRKLGAEAADFETTLVELTKSLEGNDLPSARRLVSRARHAAESARDAHFRAVMERSLQIILANAARGLDPTLARQLLKEVDDAISLGKPVDMQTMIDRRMADADAQTEAGLNERVLEARDDIVGLRQAGQNDTVALEGKLADSAIAIQDHRFLQADALLDGVEHDIHATRELLRSAAAEVLGEARGVVALAKGDGVPIDRAQRMAQEARQEGIEASAIDPILESLENALNEGRPASVLQAVGELEHLIAEQRKERYLDEQRRTFDKARGAATKFIMVKKLIEDLRKADIDIAGAEESLRAAERALEERNFDSV